MRWGALRAAKSLAKHIRRQDLQTLLLHFNCYQIFQLFSTKLLVCPFSPSSPHQTDNRDKLKEKEEEGWKTGRERERESGGGETRGARPRTPVLMGIISFYLRQLSLHSILISEQRSTVPSKENVCVWKTPSHKQDKRENTYACRLSHPTSALFLEG